MLFLTFIPLFFIILFIFIVVIVNAAKNGYYGGLVPMIRDAFLVEEMVRIDCKGLEKKDYSKIGCKLRVSFSRLFKKKKIFVKVGQKV